MPKKTKNLSYYEAIGRRRSAVARVRLYLGKKGKSPVVNAKAAKGEIFVNDMPVHEYFPATTYKEEYVLPLALTNNLDRFRVSVVVRGGGKHGQMEAMKLGIARALVLADEENRSLLKPQGLLSRDARVRERRKPGTGGRARRKKQSPKR